MLIINLNRKKKNYLQLNYFKESILTVGGVSLLYCQVIYTTHHTKKLYDCAGVLHVCVLFCCSQCDGACATCTRRVITILPSACP